MIGIVRHIERSSIYMEILYSTALSQSAAAKVSQRHCGLYTISPNHLPPNCFSRNRIQAVVGKTRPRKTRRYYRSRSTEKENDTATPSDCACSPCRRASQRQYASVDKSKVYYPVVGGMCRGFSTPAVRASGEASALGSSQASGCDRISSCDHSSRWPCSGWHQ